MSAESRQTTKDSQGPEEQNRPLNATAGSLLGFLHDGPRTGWELVVAAQQVIGRFWSLTRSQVYRELATMAASGLVRAGETGPRERRPYELTDAGRRAFFDWLDRPPGDEQIRHPLLLTVAFGRHLPPARLAEFLADHRERHAARLRGYEEMRERAGDGADRFVLATLRYGIRYEQAALDWFAELAPEIAGGAGDRAPARRS